MESIDKFVERLSAATPSPGSGGAAALTAVMGCSLIEMVAGLTLSRRKYADVKEEVEGILSAAVTLKKELIQLVEDDEYVYQRVVTVLSYQTDSNDKTVLQAIEDALIGAAQVPLQVGQHSLEVARLGERLANIGLEHAAADAAAACNLAEAAAYTAKLHIMTNLRNVANEKLKVSWRNKAARIVNEVREIADRTRTKVEEQVSAPLKPTRRRRRK